MKIDTGAFSTFITQHALSKAGVQAETAPVGPVHTGVGIGDLPFTYRREQFASVGIGVEIITNAWLNVDSREMDSNSTLDGVLGENYLAHHRVFLANDTRTAYLGETEP